MIVTSWNYTFPNWIYVILSRVKTLNGLLLVNKLNDDLTKYRISDGLKREDERIDDLDEQLRVNINWEQKKKWFGFINESKVRNYYNYYLKMRPPWQLP